MKELLAVEDYLERMLNTVPAGSEDYYWYFGGWELIGNLLAEHD